MPAPARAPGPRGRGGEKRVGYGHSSEWPWLY